MGRFTQVMLTIFLALFLCACVRGAGSEDVGDKGDDVRRQIADRYGAGEFHRVSRIRFTFNAKAGEKEVSRSWEWEPKTDRVMFRTKPDGPLHAGYSRQNVKGGGNLSAIDAKFINDRYWLLFPLHLSWDRSATVAATGMELLPSADKMAERVVAIYPPSGGYTPGDIYELFLGEEGRLIHWVYHRGGTPDPTRSTTWEEHRRFGPLLISLDRRGEDGKFRVWFTHVGVKLEGMTDWIE